MGIARGSMQVGILVAALLTGGCGVQNLWRDDTERFEEAVPLPAAVLESKGKLETLLEKDAAAREKWHREFDGRRAMRALKCLPGKLSLFDSRSDILEAVDNSCMSEADGELRDWLRQSRLKVLLTLPPLRASPPKLPEFITTTDVPSVYGMAEAAPILVVARDRKLEVLDAGTDETLYRDETLSVRPNFLAPSPNGRVFAAGESTTVVLRESESGEVLASYTGYRTLKWLDATTGIMTDTNINQHALLDGSTGKLSQPKGLTTYTGTIVRVSTNPAQFIVPGFMKLAKFELFHDDGPKIRMIEQRDRPLTGGQNGALYGTPDGRHVVIADARSIVVAASEDLEVRSFETGRFNPLSACAIDEPDSVLISGNVREQWLRTYYYVYSISNETLSPVEDERLVESSGAVRDCPVRFEVFDATYVKTQSGFRRLDNVKRGVSYRANALEAHFTELFDAEDQRMQALRERESGAGAIGGSYAARAGAPVKPLLGDDIKDATIQAVGVYEAENSSRGAGVRAERWPGPVMVIVRPTDRPLVLVLSSYEAVTWNLNLMPGAKLKAVLLGGYKTSTVTGARDTRIVAIKGHAYEASSSGYGGLDAEVMRWTGQRIGDFQGRYGGKTFMVGGR